MQDLTLASCFARCTKLIDRQWQPEVSMATLKYDYDVAISFGYTDEPFANKLYSLLEGRLKLFLYSKEQEKLAGTDGEAKFNEVFGKTAKLVVILYREAWGHTPFTRFEETAIRNRAYSEGYDFAVFIPMDDGEKQKVPAWVPKNRLYVGLERWGIEAACAVIEARFSELGGEIHEESVAELAAKVAEAIGYEERRKMHLNSREGVHAQRLSFDEVRENLIEGVATIQKTLPAINLQKKHTGESGGAIIFLSDPTGMSVNWRPEYANVMSDSKLTATFWNGHPPYPGVSNWDEPEEGASIKFAPDLTEDGRPAWKQTSTAGAGLLSPNGVADVILKWFLMRCQKG